MRENVEQSYHYLLGKMSEYDINFAAKLASVANSVDAEDPWAYDARRVTVYLSRLSMEITLKALLERAGVPVKEIRARNHTLRMLLNDLSICEVLAQKDDGLSEWVSASTVRDDYVDLGLARVPIGDLIDAENAKTSTYPNQIRYGKTVIDFDPTLLSCAAMVLSEWAKTHSRTIRLRQIDA